MQYNPQNRLHRKQLAVILESRLKNAGFNDETAKHSGVLEKVYSRSIPNTDGKVRLLVYTSIDTRTVEMRNCGVDAIRVCGVRDFEANRTLGIIKRKRVNRTGLPQDICDRMVERMRTSWAEAIVANQNPTFCKKCGAKEFITKKGKKCCSKLCWK